MDMQLGVTAAVQELAEGKPKVGVLSVPAVSMEVACHSSSCLDMALEVLLWSQENVRRLTVCNSIPE
jgi:hypothetical protein